ncbi:MAG: DUF4476 domain-containing protein [Deltaproteobacteria bacterium]|nr:DUF4476 domain-containing protein [Deltaproteobacteria bacterium]
MKSTTMLTAAVALVIGFSTTIPASARPGKELCREVAGLNDGLVAIDDAIGILSGSKVRNRPAVRRALDRLKIARLRVKDGIRDMKVLKRRVRGPAKRPGPRSAMLPRGPLPMEYGAFDTMVNGLKKLPFAADRLKMLREARKRNYFTTRQVRAVMAVFEFGADKVKAAAMMYPRVVDKQNFHEVYPDLEFENDRNALRKKVAGWDRIGLNPAGPGAVRR